MYANRVDKTHHIFVEILALGSKTVIIIKKLRQADCVHVHSSIVYLVTMFTMMIVIKVQFSVDHCKYQNNFFCLGLHVLGIFRVGGSKKRMKQVCMFHHLQRKRMGMLKTMNF